MFAPVYLDHNATAPLDVRVLEAMLPYLRARAGNPSSRHEYGRHARAAIEQARQQVAASVSAHPTEVVFTSGASEANNLFLKGAAACLSPGMVAIGATEHSSVHQTAQQLVRNGWVCRELPVTSAGCMDVARARAVLEADRPALVSAMLANNETGALSEVDALAATARRHGLWLHCDAAQALGRVMVDFRALGVHAMSLSSHKIGGPIGAGALVLDKRIEILPLIAGGGQERGLRAGTENVAAIVGFGLACELAAQEQAARASMTAALQAMLEQGVEALGATLFAAEGNRLPNTSFFAFAGIDGETLVGKLDRAGFAVGSGAACSSARQEAPRSLLAMGIPVNLARGAIRVSVGPDNRAEEIEGFLHALSSIVRDLKQLASLAA